MDWLNNTGIWFSEVGTDIWTGVVAWGKEAGPRILGSLAILIIGMWLARVIARIVRKTMSRTKVEKGVVSFVYSCLRTILDIVVVVSMIANLGVNITSVIAALGAAGITIGLALQGTLANFASGVIILFNHPFKVGDYIETEDSAGTVVSIDLMYTTLLTIDNKHVVFPNSKLTDNKLINHTGEDMRRLDLQFSAAYDTDVELVRKVLLAVCEECECVLSDRETVCGIVEMNSSAVVYEVRAWIKSSDYSNARFDLMKKAKMAFDANGIVIPFQQMDVHIKQ